MNRGKFISFVSLLLALVVLSWGVDQASTEQLGDPGIGKNYHARPTPAERKAAGEHYKGVRDAVISEGVGFTAAPGPGQTPDYFGPYPNYANSPLPDMTNCSAPAYCGIRKFIDTLPNLTIAVPDACSYSGQAADCYEIELRQYTQKMHSDLPLTTLRGYVQVKNGVDVAPISYLGPVIVAQRDKPVRITFRNKLSTGTGGNLFIPVDTTYMGAGMGPDGMTMYTENRAVLHLHGGTTPWISDGTPHQWTTPSGEVTSYPEGVSVFNVPDMPDPGPGSLTFFYTNQQSARLMFYHDHAYGITRLNVYAGEAAGYLLTDQVEQDLINGTNISGGNPSLSKVLPNIGMPLIIQDKTFVPDNTRPFTNQVGVFASQLEAQDPTWDIANWGGPGNLWFPHVYMPNQNPYDMTGMAPMGRWDYGPWFWPPFTGLTFGPIPNPYYDPVNAPWEPPFIPGTPPNPTVPIASNSPSGVPESFLDTPVVNGKAYPVLTVQPKPYRFRVLNAANDRFFNLQLYQATGIVSGISISKGGSGYTSPPVVTITGDGTGATATATIDAVTGAVTGINIATVGSGYTTATVTIAPPLSGSTAIVKATVYTAPTEVGMVPAITGSWPAGWGKPDSRDGGWPDPAKRGPAMIQIGTEGGFLPAPALIPNVPVDYDYFRRSITVLNVLQKSLFLGPAERADVIVDFTKFAGKTLILYNDAPAPVPGFDPRIDYYTADPDQTLSGGAPSTLPGFGPNTRTIMQIRVSGSGGTAPPDDYNPTILAKLQTALPAAFAASQDTIIVPQAPYNAVYNGNFPGDATAYVKIQDTTFTFTPIGQTTPLMFNLEPKSIIEDFQMDYGRMNAMIGVEIPHTNITNQTSIIQHYYDPPTEIIRYSDEATLIGAAEDGTQLWKITHNGVDTHSIHVHMFNAQLVNRVGWDGAIKPPDPNELGWKETFRMNPLEDAILALRPINLTLPFKIPNSIRPLDPTMPLGSTTQFTGIDPNGNPVTVTNELTNFGSEYVWHCHLLGHEENDMMRAMVLAVVPDAPSNLIATSNVGVDLTWTDNSLNETDWVVQSAPANTGPWTDLATVPSTTGPTTGTVMYTTAAANWYRVLASNTVGSTAPGYPTMTVNSTPSNIATPLPPTYSISGTVSKAGGAPVAGVTMSLTGAATATTTTAANGTYSFTGLANGSYTVTPSMGTNTFTPASSPAVINNANVPGVNFTMNTYSISGTVTISGGAPVAGVTMSLTGAATATTTTAANGTYTFTGLANGSYTVTPSLGTNTFSPSSITSINVNGANVTAQDFMMNIVTTYSISGVVSTSRGAPKANVTMTLSDAATATTTTNGAGQYSFTNLGNGSYVVTPKRTGCSFTPTSRNLTISGGNVTGQNFVVGKCK